MLVELKNGETLNGHLVNCDTWMNLTLKEVVQTSPVRFGPHCVCVCVCVFYENLGAGESGNFGSWGLGTWEADEREKKLMIR